MNLNGDIVIDSLPYCDEMLDLSQANQLVLKEMKGFKASEESVKLDLNILLRNELERAGRGEKMDVIDTDKFKMSTPELESHSAKGKKTGAAANLEHQKWLDAVNNAKSQLCYQDGRAVNLNLLQLYGSNQWRTANWQLEQTNKIIQDEINVIQDHVDELNKQRNHDQVDCLTNS